MTTRPPKVDYDRIAPRYDAYRGWDGELSRKLLERAVPALGREEEQGAGAGAALLEVGCGTGNLTGWLKRHWAGPVVGLDLSRGMLGQARAKLGRTWLVRADAQRLPFRESSFGAAVGAYFLHYLEDEARARFFERLRGVLGGARPHPTHPGGAAFLTASHVQIQSCTLTRWFPSAARIDCARFPAVERLRAELSAAGFRNVRTETVRRARPRGDRAYLEKIRNRFISTLELLPSGEFEAGLAAMEKELRTHGHLGDVSWKGTIVYAAVPLEA